MTATTTLSSREFNQDTSGAKKAAMKGPVVITDRGQPSHVLLTYQRFQELSATKLDIVAALAMPEAADIEFEPAPLRSIIRPAEFS